MSSVKRSATRSTTSLTPTPLCSPPTVFTSTRLLYTIHTFLHSIDPTTIRLWLIKTIRPLPQVLCLCTRPYLNKFPNYIFQTKSKSTYVATLLLHTYSKRMVIPSYSTKFKLWNQPKFLLMLVNKHFKPFNAILFNKATLINHQFDFIQFSNKHYLTTN